MIWKFFMHEVSMVGLGLGLICCVSSAILKLSSESMDVMEWELMSLNSLEIIFTFVFDWISLLFAGFVFLFYF